MRFPLYHKRPGLRNNEFTYTALAQGMEAAEKGSKEIQANPNADSQVNKVSQHQKTQCHRCLGTGHSAALSIQVHSVQQVQKNWTYSTCMQDKTLSVPSKTTSSTRAR